MKTAFMIALLLAAGLVGPALGQEAAQQGTAQQDSAQDGRRHLVDTADNEGTVPAQPDSTVPAQPKVEAPPPWSKWTYYSQADSRYGGQQHYAFVAERDDAFGRVYVQCTGDGRLYAFVTTQFLGRGEPRPPVRYQIDRQPSIALRGHLSHDARAVFIAEGRKAFIGGLRRGGKISFATRRDDGFAMGLRFTLKGSSKTIEKVLRACDYDARADRTPVESDAEARAAAEAMVDAEINEELKTPKSGIQVETLY